MQSGVYTNLVSFFKRAVRGYMRAAKFGINGCWYPRTLSTLQSSFRFRGVLSHSMIVEILSEAMVIPYSVRQRPRKSISETSKVHLDGLRDK